MRYYRSLLFTLLGPRSRREKRINGAIQPRVKTIEQNVAILNRRGQSCRRTQATIDNDPPPRCPILPTNWPSCPTILSTTIIITLMTTIILTINRMTRILMQVGSFFHKYFFFQHRFTVVLRINFNENLKICDQKTTYFLVKGYRYSCSPTTT